MPKKKKMKKKKVVKKTKIVEVSKNRRWSVLNADIQQEVKTEAALFHDPSLFFRDQGKDRSKNVINELEERDASGNKHKVIIEKNPLMDGVGLSHIYTKAVQNITKKKKKKSKE